MKILLQLFLFLLLGVLQLVSINESQAASQSTYSRTELDARLSAMDKVQENERDSLRREMADLRAHMDNTLSGHKNNVDTTVAHADKFLVETKEWVSSQKEYFNWTIAIMGLGIAAFGMLFTQKLRAQYQAEISAVQVVKSQAEHLLDKISTLHTESSKHAEAILKERELVNERAPGKEATEEEKQATKAVAGDEELPFAERLRALGLSAIDDENWKEAHNYWRALSTYKPDSEEARFYLALTLQNLARLESGSARKSLLEEASSEYDHVVRLNPDDSASYNNWGNVLSEQAVDEVGDARQALLKEAVTKYAEALRLKPEEPCAYYNMGLALFNQAEGEKGEARQALLKESASKFAKVIRIEPDKPDAYYNMGLALLKQAEGEEGEARQALLKEAILKFAEAVRLKPDEPSTYHHMGLALLKQSEGEKGEVRQALLKEAIMKFAETVRLKPDEPGAYHHMGLALLKQSEGEDGEVRQALLKEAILKLAQAVRLKPDVPDGYNNWGVALRKQSEGVDEATRRALLKEAVLKFAEAARLNPDELGTYKNWAGALIKQAECEVGAARQVLLNEAKEKCFRAESLQKGTGAYNLACISALQGEQDECKKWLATCRDSGTLESREHLATDSDLDSVRELEWFKQFMSEVC